MSAADVAVACPSCADLERALALKVAELAETRLALHEMTGKRNAWRLRARCWEPAGEDDEARTVRLAEVEQTGGRR